MESETRVLEIRGARRSVLREAAAAITAQEIQEGDRAIAQLPCTRWRIARAKRAAPHGWGPSPRRPQAGGRFGQARTQEVADDPRIAARQGEAVIAELEIAAWQA